VRDEIDGRRNGGVGSRQVDGCLVRIAGPGDNNGTIDEELGFEHVEGKGKETAGDLEGTRQGHLSAFLPLGDEVYAAADIEGVPTARVDDDVEEGAGIAKEVEADVEAFYPGLFGAQRQGLTVDEGIAGVVIDKANHAEAIDDFRIIGWKDIIEIG